MLYITFILGLLTGIFSPAIGANHALLIGVGKYPAMRNADLDGPKYDIQALQKLLKTSFKLPEHNIVTIADRQATRDGILKAMNNLLTRTRAGDQVFIYFSGHGTSSYDPGHKRFDIEPHTGALIPSDYGQKRTLQGMMSTLIIGKRDIRPVLEKLEKDRQLFVVFDACYSGQTVRKFNGVKNIGKARYIPLLPESDDLIDDDLPKQYGEGTQTAPPYPYKNTIYLSASSGREMAWDINYSALKQGAETIDGRPHGVLTNALLWGLNGESDTDNNGVITYNELFQYIRSKVTSAFRQTPQVLFPKAKNILMNRPVFAQSIAKPTPAEKPVQVNETKKLILKSHNLSPTAIAYLDNIPGVSFSDKKYHIMVSKINNSLQDSRSPYRLLLPSGALLAEISANKLKEQVKRQVMVRELIDFSYKNQDFNVFLNLLGSKGVLVEGDSIGFSILPGSDTYVMLVNITPGGSINVLYPYNEHSIHRLKKGQELSLPDFGRISPPDFGTEHVKVFAFKNKPVDFEKYVRKNFLPGSTLFKGLMNMVSKPGLQAAQMTLQVKTRPRDDLVVFK